MSEIADFLNAQYRVAAEDHIETEHGCMRCGDDWPCFTIRDIESKRRMFSHLVVDGHALDHCDRCMVLRLLAAPFSAEPGYKAEEWAV